MLGTQGILRRRSIWTHEACKESSEVLAIAPRIYAGRAPGGHCHHWRPCRAAAPCYSGGARKLPAQFVREQSQAAWRRLARLSDSPDNFSAGRRAKVLPLRRLELACLDL